MSPLPRLLTAFIFLACLAAAFWRIPALPDAPPVVPASTAPLPPFFVSSQLPAVADSVGAASLARLPDGRIAAVWQAGPRDDPARTALWFSLLEPGGWRDPWPVANRESTAGALFAHIGGIGNPVLQAAGDTLQLWFATRGIRGQSGAGIAYAQSFDAGESWSSPRLLLGAQLSWNSLHLAGPPRMRPDGGADLPLQDDATPPRQSWLHLTVDGQILGKTPRSPEFPVLPTAPGTRYATLRLNSGRLLLAGNPPGGRQVLQLWWSNDGGKHWLAGKTLESAPDSGAKFTEPALLLAPDGRVHLAYTCQHQAIKVASFSEAWLDGGDR